MDGYLLDTNITNYWHNASLPQHALVAANISTLPSDASLRISVVTLGEVEFGHLRTTTPAPTRPEKIFFQTVPLPGGRFPRDRIRVASLSGRRGDGMGRAEWEREYYGDVLRRLAT